MSQKLPREYEIRTVSDFFQVPADRRQTCLDQFGMWMEITASIRDLAKVVKGVNAPIDLFTWIDDGKDDANIRVKIVPEPETDREGRTPSPPGR